MSARDAHVLPERPAADEEMGHHPGHGVELAGLPPRWAWITPPSSAKVAARTSEGERPAS